MPAARGTDQNISYQDHGRSRWAIFNPAILNGPNWSLRHLIWGPTRYIGFPVGRDSDGTTVSANIPAILVPPIPSATGPTPADQGTVSTDRPAPPPNPTLLFPRTPYMRARDWFEYHSNPGAFLPPLPGQNSAPPAPPPVVAPTPAATPPIAPPAPTGGTMDLGQLATGLLYQYGSRWINQQFAPPTTVPATGSPTPAATTATAPTPAHSCGNGGGSWVYKRVCGEYRWVQVRRRRRKRLATQSDLRDLAALKGVLGSGKAFDTWIATHPS